MDIKEVVTGAVITVVIGGTAYTVNQHDVADNFAKDTGFTQEQAEEYVDSVEEEDLVPFSEIGQSYIDDAQEALDYAEEVDCEMYVYDWESSTLSCQEGIEQINVFAEKSMALGIAYKDLDTDMAGETEVITAISAIDAVKPTYDLEIVQFMYESADIEEYINTEAYNKALLTTSLEQM